MPLTGKGTASGGSLRGTASQTGGRLCAILAAISIVLFVISCREGNAGVLGVVRFAFQTVTTPVRYIGVLVGTPLSAIGNVAANLTASQETLSELREENERLRSENVELAEGAQMSERLEALLQLRSTYNLKSTGARVISSSTDSWTSSVTIDKGAGSGIAVGMPVAYAKGEVSGAIGQVIEVSAASAVVRLLSDENSSVSAMVQTSRAQGSLDGSADGTLRLALIRTDQTVEVGDNVVTSGLGGVFPKGLSLGRVASVEKAPGALYYDIVVEPLFVMGSFEEVLVITSLTEEQRATAEDIAAADAQEASSASASVTDGAGDGEGAAGEDPASQSGGDAEGEGAGGEG